MSRNLASHRPYLLIGMVVFVWLTGSACTGRREVRVMGNDNYVKADCDGADGGAHAGPAPVRPARSCQAIGAVSWSVRHTGQTN